MHEPALDVLLAASLYCRPHLDQPTRAASPVTCPPAVYLRPDTASAELRERAAALLPLLDPVLEKALGYSLPRPGAAAGELALMPLHPRRAGGAFEAAQARR